MKPLTARPTEFLQLDISGGVVLDGWMMKPRDFDPTKKYPVLVYVFGEPAAAPPVRGRIVRIMHSLIFKR
jgi:dipeptidyl aminopeptidase/acylaminoacyl peptidase